MPILEYKHRMREYIDVDKPEVNLNQSFNSNSSLLQRRQKINSIKSNLRSDSMKKDINKGNKSDLIKSDSNKNDINKNEKLSLNKFQ